MPAVHRSNKKSTGGKRHNDPAESTSCEVEMTVVILTGKQHYGPLEVGGQAALTEEDQMLFLH